MKLQLELMVQSNPLVSKEAEITPFIPTLIRNLNGNSSHQFKEKSAKSKLTETEKHGLLLTI